MLDKMHAEQEKSGESLVLGYEKDLAEKVTAIRKKIEEYDYSTISKDPEESTQKASLYPTIFDETYKEIVDQTKAAVQEDDPKKARNTKKDLTNLWQSIESSSSDMPLLADSVKEILDTSTPYINKRLKKVGGLRGTFDKMKDKAGAGLANMLQLGAVAALSVALPTGLTALAVTGTASKLKEKREFKAEEDKKIADMAAKMYTDEESQKVTQLAEGGIVTKPTKAIVGEKGPEAVLPLAKLTQIFTALFSKQTQAVETLADSASAPASEGGGDFDPSAWMDVVESEADRITATAVATLAQQGAEQKTLTESFYSSTDGALGILERIRRGVGGIPLTLGERIGGFFTNLGGLFPNRRSRKEAEKSSMKSAQRDKIQEEASDQRTDIYDILLGIGETMSDSLSLNENEARAARERFKEAGRKGKDKKTKVTGKKDPIENSWFTWVVLIGASLTGLAYGLTIGLFKIYKWVFTSIKTAIMESKLAKSIGRMFLNIKNLIMNSGIVKFFKGLFPAKEGGGIFKKTKDAIVRAWKTTKNAFLVAKNFVLGIIFRIKNTFTMIKTAVMNFFAPVVRLIDAVKRILGIGKQIGGVGKTVGIMISPLGKAARFLFGIFKTVGMKLMWPLQIVMSFFDGLFESFDAVGKSVGFFASVLNGILGFFFGVIDGFFMVMFDFLKDIIAWVAGALGFEEFEKWLDSFSFSKMWNEFTDGIYDVVNKLFMWETWETMFDDMVDWFMGLLDFSSFSAGLMSAVKLIFLPLTALVKLVTVIWDWFKGLFTFDEAKDTPKEEEGQGFMAYIGDAISAMWSWILGIFTWGSADAPKEEEGTGFLAYIGEAIGAMWAQIKSIFTWSSSEDSPEADSKGFLGYIGDAISAMWAKIKSIFTWGSDDEPEENESTGFLAYISNAISSMWTAIKSIFTWSDSEDSPEEDSKGFLGYIGDAIGAMWRFVKGIFSFTPFGFLSDIGFFSILTDAIGDMWKNIKSIFTFGAEDGQEKGKGFFEILGDAIKSVWEALTSVFDIDWGENIKTLAQSVMPGWMFDWFYDGDEPAAKESAKVEPPKEAEKASSALASMVDDMPDINGILNQVDWTQFDLGSWMSFDLNFGQKLKGMLLSLFPSDLSPVGTKSEKGGLVGMSQFSSTSLGKSLGLESGGLFTLSQGELIVPEPTVKALQSFTAGLPPSSGTSELEAELLAFTAEIPPSSGRDLTNLQREMEAAGGAGGSMTVVNQSTVQNNASSPLMLPPTQVRPSNSFNPASMQNNN